MPSYNKIILIGRVTRDPEMNHMQSGLSVASFSIAVDRPFKNQAGERVTDFFDCKAWRQKSEFVEKYVKKGRLIAVEGRVELGKYTTKEGQERRTMDVVCDQVELLDSQRDAAGEAAPPGGGQGYYGDEEAGGGRPASRGGGRPPMARADAPAAAPGRAPLSQGRAPAAPAPAAFPAEDDFDDSDPFADE